jgi:hypothetical protein
MYPDVNTTEIAFPRSKPAPGMPFSHPHHGRNLASSLTALVSWTARAVAGLRTVPPRAPPTPLTETHLDEQRR